ncbi:MAG: SDR family oxidoreductase [Alphaproteobacteria bacterium]|nr:SDR family oxidoreductase [Alphaproteobacteria bacterium]
MGVLDGQHALITGGGAGIGAAIAKALAGEGAAVSLAGRRREPLEAVAAGLAKAIAVPADVTDEDQVALMVERAGDAFGPVSILIANAGSASSAPLAKTSLEAWQATMAVNLTGAFLSARAVLPAMSAARSGRIIFIASTAGLKGYGYVAPYCAAKHGVVGLARALALELAKDGITVNAVCPGYTETPMLEASIDNIVEKTGRSEAEVRAALMQGNPQARFVQPEEVAATVLWLCSPGADAINGQAIAVAGGEI